MLIEPKVTEPNLSLKQVSRVVKIEEADSTIQNHYKRDYFKEIQGNKIYAKQFSTVGVSGWYSTSCVGGDIHTVISNKAFIEVNKDRTLSLDEIAYQLAEWACFRSTWVDRIVTVTLWAEINKHELSRSEMEYVFENWSSYIESH